MDLCVVKGILTPSETLSAPNPVITILNRKKSDSNVTPHHNINWQNILKDATFHSLIKHTGFTPSLDEKIETDRLLWEKIQSARFLRKQGKIDDFDKVKTGVLVDTTREHGYLEFRQSDRSVYNCEQSRCKSIYDKLLALWRIQKFEPNDIWIRVKIPRYPSSEDVYEYTSKQGLKQINADIFQNDKTHNEWKTSDDLENISFEKLENNEKLPISRLDSEYFHVGDEMKNIYKKQAATSVYKQPTYTIVSGARQPYLPYIVGLQLEGLRRPEIKNTAWPQGGTYLHPIEPVTLVSEFRKNEKVYDGFIPSLGPTGRPPPSIYQQTIPKPVVFGQYPAYVSTRIENTGIYFTSTTPKNFKPSTEFVRYSEPDPFYADNTYAYTTPRTNDLTDIKYELSNPNESNQYPTSINSQLLIYDDNKRNDSEIITSNDNVKSTLLPEIETIPTANTINVLHVTEDEEQILLPTSGTTKERSTTSLATLPTTNRVQIKHTQRSTTAFSSETYGYAPLFVKWGDKIKPTTSNKSSTNINTPKIIHNYELKRQKIEELSTKAPKMNDKLSLDLNDEIKSTTDKEVNTLQDDINSTPDPTTTFTNYNYKETITKEIDDETIKYSKQNLTTIQELNDTITNESSTITNESSTITDEPFNETSSDDWSQTTTIILDPKLINTDTNSYNIDSGTTNLVINIEDKSPEEVVNELTTIGVKNTTRIEGYPESNESSFGNYNTLPEKVDIITSTIRTTDFPDQETDDTDPISIVVNRISKSFSYKTAKGKTRNLKQIAKTR